MNTPCFNNENNYQLNVGYSNDNYVAQAAINPYKGISLLGNSGFSSEQNNNDISLGYTFNDILSKGLGAEMFVGYGFGETKYAFTKTTNSIFGSYVRKGVIDNKFEKYICQIDLYYVSPENVQICIYARYSSLYFKPYYFNIYYETIPEDVYEKKYANLNVQAYDAGFAFKYQIKHFGYFLQATYTWNNSRRIGHQIVSFQKKFPVFFGAGLTFYWKSFKRKKTKN